MSWWKGQYLLQQVSQGRLSQPQMNLLRSSSTNSDVQMSPAYFLHKVMEFVIQLLMTFSFLTPLLSKNSIVISEFHVQQESLSALRFCSPEPVRLGGNTIGWACHASFIWIRDFSRNVQPNRVLHANLCKILHVYYLASLQKKCWCCNLKTFHF